MRNLIATTCMGMALSSCTFSIHNVHVGDFSPVSPGGSADGRLVRGQAEQFVVLGFTDQTLYVDEAYQKIQAACPNGEIRGLTTQHSTAHGFFSWTNKLLIQGYCFEIGSGKGRETIRG